MLVIKSNGKTEKFIPNKTRKWVVWSVEGLKDQVDMEYYILSETIKRLPERVTTEEIHQTMIKVCLDKEDINYSRVAAKLEFASVYKAQERELGLVKPFLLQFSDIIEVMEQKGLWKGDWLLDDDLVDYEDLINEWYIELESKSIEYWTIKQWSDKYSVNFNGKPVETPAMGCLALAMSLHGVTQLAFDLAMGLVKGKINCPTPVLNGCRNDDYNSISCCLIEGGDTVASIDTATSIASLMTAKKAGIGITLDTRSSGDPVKSGAVKHLGKQPLFRSVESLVKNYTQITRGGSATITIKAVDPDILTLLKLKTQKMDLARRVDKVDYNFAYNDHFAHCVINNDDWYLFSKIHAPEVHDNFHAEDYEDYVKLALRRGAPYTKIKALDLLRVFGDSRWETARVYNINLTRTNKHTPFFDKITQSNLCLEIALPTKPYINGEDLYSTEKSEGEVAFCAIAAINAAKVSKEEYPHIAEVVLRTVDRMITLAPALTRSMKESMMRRRSVGIGITGLASFLYQQGLDYDGSPESLEATESLAELHYYSLLQASQTMSKETGFEVDGIDVNWLPIDTKYGSRNPTLDWESLRGKPRMHSVLVAHMPVESSSAFSSSTNGLYPSRKRVIYKKARTGRVQFISEHFVNKKSAWEVDMIPYYSAVQNYTDQAISADYYTDFTRLKDKKIPFHKIIDWFLGQWAAGIKTAYYQNINDGAGQEMKLEDTCEGGSCKL